MPGPHRIIPRLIARAVRAALPSSDEDSMPNTTKAGRAPEPIAPLTAAKATTFIVGTIREISWETCDAGKWARVRLAEESDYGPVERIVVVTGPLLDVLAHDGLVESVVVIDGVTREVALPGWPHSTDAFIATAIGRQRDLEELTKTELQVAVKRAPLEIIARRLSTTVDGVQSRCDDLSVDLPERRASAA